MNRPYPGVREESIVGRSLYDFTSPEYHDTVREALQTVLREGGRASYEVVGLGVNGGRAWYANHVSAIRGADEVTNALIVGENITERRRAEEQRRESEARFHAAVEASMDAFLTLASRRDDGEEIADFVITGLNARAAAMLSSMQREQLLGQRLSELVTRSRPASSSRSACASSGKERRSRRRSSCPRRPPSRRARASGCTTRIVPIQDGVAVTMRDTTDRKRLEDQLRQSIERLEVYAEELEGKNRMLAEENAERERTASVLRQQQEAIRALSTPIIQAWEGVLVLPIIGALDSGRATEIMEKLLGEIVRTQAHFAVLDLTGVEDVDAPTVDHLFQVARAASLLGSRCLVSGHLPRGRAGHRGARQRRADASRPSASWRTPCATRCVVSGARLPSAQRKAR